LFRNLGGSFGVAFVTTMLERRTQFHHGIMAQHLTPENSGFRQSLEVVTQHLITMGASPADAAQKAFGVVAGVAEKNAVMLAFLDCFLLLGIVAFAGLPLALLIKKFRSGAPPAGGH
jgi:DHA2 family multidrug resistance protein